MNNPENIEPKIERVESETEQVEQKFEKVKQEIASLEAAIASLNTKGDAKVAGALQHTLEQKKAEEAEITARASNILSKLENIRREVKVVDQWNIEAQNQLSQLNGMDVSEAQSRVADRQRWVEQMDQQYNNLKQKLANITNKSFG